jgi:hypothetical protein
VGAFGSRNGVSSDEEAVKEGEGFGVYDKEVLVNAALKININIHWLSSKYTAEWFRNS